VQRRPERYVPRPYALAAAARILAPALVRRVLGGGANANGGSSSANTSSSSVSSAGGAR